jgi:hypothetical protein
MSDDQNAAHTEDIPLEGSESESVVGGAAMSSEGERVYTMEEETFRLMSQGYVEEACTKEGTLFVNPKTNHRVTLKFG